MKSNLDHDELLIVGGDCVHHIPRAIDPEENQKSPLYLKKNFKGRGGRGERKHARTTGDLEFEDHQAIIIHFPSSNNILERERGRNGVKLIRITWIYLRLTSSRRSLSSRSTWQLAHRPQQRTEQQSQPVLGNLYISFNFVRLEQVIQQ
jgi:hypothetical protein